MDPRQALIDAMQAFLAGDFDAARDALSSYHHWRGRLAGFEPEVNIGGDNLAKLIGTAIGE